MVSNKPKILLIGPPGAGKTVLANKISEIFNIPFVKLGSLLRDLKPDHPFYNQINSAMLKGELAPNNLVASILKDSLEKLTNGYVLDGWARQLSDLEEYNPQVDLVLYLNCPKDISKDRITKRVVCKIDNSIYSFSDTVCHLCGGVLEKRSDDTEETFERRWKLYEEKTLDVLKFYRNMGILVEIDASKSIPEITNQIRELL